MNITLKQADQEDIAPILAIINHAILTTTAVYDYQPRTYEAQSAWFEKKRADGMPVIVAQQDNQTIGFGSYGIFRPWDGYRFSVEHSIYISESFRGAGVGGKILTELIRLATEQGFHTLIAGVDAANESSYAFHKRYGFVEVGRFREVGYKFDMWLDLVFMQLFLKTQ